MFKVLKQAFHDTFSVASALLWGTDVSKERLRKRLEICHDCSEVVISGTMMRCGICHCQVAEQGLINLARYEETSRYGCKYERGSRWKEANV